jgi:hypothetical protein
MSLEFSESRNAVLAARFSRSGVECLFEKPAGLGRRERRIGERLCFGMVRRVCVGRSSPATSIASRHTKVNGMTTTEHEQASYWAVCFMCDEIAPKTTFWGDRLVCQRCKADLELTREEENEEE